MRHPFDPGLQDGSPALRANIERLIGSDILESHYQSIPTSFKDARSLLRSRAKAEDVIFHDQKSGVSAFFIPTVVTGPARDMPVFYEFNSKKLTTLLQSHLEGCEVVVSSLAAAASAFRCLGYGDYWNWARQPLDHPFEHFDSKEMQDARPNEELNYGLYGIGVKVVGPKSLKRVTADRSGNAWMMGISQSIRIKGASISNIIPSSFGLGLEAFRSQFAQVYANFEKPLVYWLQEAKGPWSFGEEARDHVHKLSFMSDGRRFTVTYSSAPPVLGSLDIWDGIGLLCDFYGLKLPQFNSAPLPANIWEDDDDNMEEVGTLYQSDDLALLDVLNALNPYGDECVVQAECDGIHPSFSADNWADFHPYFQVRVARSHAQPQYTVEFIVETKETAVRLPPKRVFVVSVTGNTARVLEPDDVREALSIGSFTPVTILDLFPSLGWKPV